MVARRHGRLRAAAVLAGFAVLTSALASRALTVERSVVVPMDENGTARSYRLHVPRGLPDTTPVPLVLVLHGLYSTAEGIETESTFDDYADLYGFVVAYPEGLHASWNAGRCCGVAVTDQVDDVQFLSHVVADVRGKLFVDPARVYATGFSNGGMMALRLACERPDTFAAVGSIGGTLEVACPAGRAISAMTVEGLGDATVPYDGTPYSSFLNTALTPVPTTVGRLQARSMCSGLPDEAVDGTVSVRAYPACGGGASVELVTLADVGHAWPHDGRDGYNATLAMWRFFAQHRPAAHAPYPDPVLSTRLTAHREDGLRVVAGDLLGRYDAVGEVRLAVEAKRKGRWVRIAVTSTGYDGHYAVPLPGPYEPVRVRFPGGAAQPSTSKTV